jgi:hypothetical protein
LRRPVHDESEQRLLFIGFYGNEKTPVASCGKVVAKGADDSEGKKNCWQGVAC